MRRHSTALLDHTLRDGAELKVTLSAINKYETGILKVTQKESSGNC
jgi:hypothetical protein